MSTLLAAALALLAASPLGEGYQKTKWGMTPAEVKALYPTSMDADQARKLQPGRFGKSEEFVLAKTTVLGKDAWATFRFDKSGLARVSVRPDPENSGDCPRLSDALSIKYGDATSKVAQDTDDLFVLNGTWETKETRIELTCSSIKTKAQLEKMKKAAPDESFPSDVPADAVLLEYKRK